MATTEERISSHNIVELKENEVFVFGSNESGLHGKGAAKTALKWGARWGVANGYSGKTYAIPTKDKRIAKTLSLSKIGEYVSQFIDFAKNNQDLKFLVTEIGCGLAGLNPKDVAPLFKDAVTLQNVYLPKSFWKYLSQPTA